MKRDWSRERWRKQCVREPLQERRWPVVVRGLRELLKMLAEDDGTIVEDEDDPEQALIAALAPHTEELALVRAAVALLLRKGLLASDGRSIWVTDMPPLAAERSAEVRGVEPPPDEDKPARSDPSATPG